MKKILQLGFLMSHLLLFLPGVMATAMAQEMSIPDAALERAIWQTLGRALPVGTLTAQDMLALTSLDVSGVGVKSLEGLGAAHNLTTLDLGYNELTSLTLPPGFTRLTTLDLRGNELTSLTLPRRAHQSNHPQPPRKPTD